MGLLRSIFFCFFYLCTFHSYTSAQTGDGTVENNTAPMNSLTSLPKSVSTIDGKKLYLTFCSECHGEYGSPSDEIRALFITPPKDLTVENIPKARSRKEIVKIIREGQGENMIPYGTVLSNAQINSIAKYVLDLGRRNGEAGH